MNLYSSNGIVSADGTNYSWRGDFLGFTFGGVHSSSLGIVRTSDGNRYQDILLPSRSDKTATVSGLDETYYFGTDFTQKDFSINFSFDYLTDKQIRKLRRLYSRKEPQDLIFDEEPYKVYSVVCKEPPQLTYICFTENKTRIYKGEGTINFVAYFPFARARYKYSEDYNLYNIPEWGGIKSNKKDWLDTSGIRSKETEFPIAAKLLYERYSADREDKSWLSEIPKDNNLKKLKINGTGNEEYYRLTTNYIDNFEKANKKPDNTELFSINYYHSDSQDEKKDNQQVDEHQTHDNEGNSIPPLIMAKTKDNHGWIRNQIIPLINPGDRSVPFKIKIFYDSLAVETNNEDLISKRFFDLYLNYGKKVTLIEDSTGTKYNCYIPNENRECGHLRFRLDWRCVVEVDMENRLIKGDFLEMREVGKENVGTENEKIIVENKVIKNKDGIILTGNVTGGDFFMIPPTEDDEVLILRLDIENETKTNNRVSYQKGYFVKDSLEYNYLYY